MSAGVKECGRSLVLNCHLQPMHSLTFGLCSIFRIGPHKRAWHFSCDETPLLRENVMPCRPRPHWGTQSPSSLAGSEMPSMLPSTVFRFLSRLDLPTPY